MQRPVVSRVRRGLTFEQVAAESVVSVRLRTAGAWPLLRGAAGSGRISGDVMSGLRSPDGRVARDSRPVGGVTVGPSAA